MVGLPDILVCLVVELVVAALHSGVSGVVNAELLSVVICLYDL